MVEPVGHRQTKGAATDMLEPKATASHLDSTNRVSLAACRSLPVFHEQRTSSDRPGMSQTCQLKNRHGRFRDCDLLRKLFETMVRRCMAEGLVDGAAFAVDASLIAADANKQRSAVGSADVDWEAIARTRRSVREYLDTLDEAAWGAASETASARTSFLKQNLMAPAVCKPISASTASAFSMPRCAP